MPPSAPAERPLDAALLREWPLAHEDGDKHERGTILIVGGSPQTPGAVLLAATAAMRMGAGRLQIATAGETAPHLAVAVPEALVADHDDTSQLVDLVARADAIVLGPGVRDATTTRSLLATVLEHAPGTVPLVVDAGAISELVGRVEQIGARRVVLTPNRQELGRLLGDDVEDPERAAAARFGVTIASFGRVATPDGRVWHDDVDVDGLGTSGSGDVLAGAIGGAAARCGDAVCAACWGLYVHRLAGTRLCEQIGPAGYLARELADELPRAIAAVESGD